MKVHESLDDAEQFLLETARHIEAGGELTTEQQEAYLNAALLLMAESLMDEGGMSQVRHLQRYIIAGMVLTASQDHYDPRPVIVEDGLLELSIRGEKE